MTPPLDTLTVAHSWRKLPQTKRIGRDRRGGLIKHGFTKEKLYAFTEMPVFGIEDLATRLGGVARDPYAGVVRGTLIPGAPTPCRRLARPDPATGDAATLAPTPRRVTAFDVDGIPQGPAEDPAFDPEDAIEHVIGLLAEAADPSFADASFWWQYSSSQGFAPGRLHLRLWGLASRPVSDQGMRRWAAAVNRRAGFRLVDPALYSCNQLHYTAAPILDGIPDPLPRRSGFRRGLSDTVEIAVPEPIRVATTGGGEGLKPAHGFEHYLAGIGGEHGFNNGIYRAICSYVGTHGVEGTDPAALRERLREAVRAAPPGHRGTTEIERYASDRYLDDEIGRVLARGEAEVRHARELAEGLLAGEGAREDGPEPHWPADELDPAEAAARLDAVLGEQVARAYAWTPATGPALQVGIQAAAGLGKTSRAFAKMAEHASTVAVESLGFVRTEIPETHVFAPETKLLAEQALIARDHGLPTQVVRGRGAKLEGGPPCRKHDEAAVVAKAGLSVMWVLCREGTAAQPGATCEFYEGCTFLKQFASPDPAVRLFPHNYLPLMADLPKMPPSFGMPAPALTAIDEGFWQSLIQHVSFPLERLMDPRPGMKLEVESEIREVAARVRDLMERGEDPRTVASTATFRRLADLEMSAGAEANIGPGMKWKAQKDRVGELKTSYAYKLAAFWRVLADECGKPRSMQRIELRRDVRIGDGEPRNMVLVHCRRELATVGPVLALDASLSPMIARKFLPRLEVATINARLNAHVTQVSDTPFSRFKLLASSGAAAKNKRTAENTLHDVRHFAEVVVGGVRRRHGLEARTLLVTYMEAAERLRGLGEIVGLDVIHLGALRGIDRYKEHAAVIIVGRQEPSLHGTFDKDGTYRAGAEDMTRAVFGDEDEPLAVMSAEEWHEAGEVRGYRMRDGSRRGAKVRVHRDRRVQEIVEQIREQETMQALSRLRLVHRAAPAEVFILSNVVLPVTVDRLVRWNELMPSRLEVAATRLDGVVPLAPAWLAERHPDLWKTAKAAELEVARVVKTPQAPIKVLLLEDEEFSAATYRRVGQRGRASQALIRADHPDPEAALEKLVGALAMFRWEEPLADDFADPRTWGVDEPRSADVVPLMSACSRCGDPTPPGTAVCSVCHGLAAREAASAAAPEPARPSTAPPARQGIVVDTGPPPLLHFRGQGSPSVPVISQIFTIGRRVVVDVLSVSPLPAPAGTGLAA